MFYSRLSWFLTGVGCFLRSRYTYVPHSASTTLQTSVKFWKILRYVLSIDYEMLCVALLEYCRFLLGTSKSRAAPPTVFSVVLVVSFPVFFVLLVLRVWVNSSYCQSRETLFNTLNKVCYKKSLRMFLCGVLTISRASSQLLFPFSCLVCRFPGFWWWN